MEAIRKQATKLREQVAKQQQAVLRQFSGRIDGSDTVADEAEIQQHQKLEKLYISTRATKHFQRDIVRGIEGYMVTGSKQIEIGTRLSDDSRKYSSENSGSTLSKAALSFSKARAQMEKEHDSLLRMLGTQVTEPLRAMVVGSALEDARHLAQKYDRVRQEAESQVIEVARCQARVKETDNSSDNTLKLEAAEMKLNELKSKMATLGKEATAAMAAVERQQQRLTLQRLIAMVEAERSYHQHVLQLLDQLEQEMLNARQQTEISPIPASDNRSNPENLFASQPYDGSTDGMGFFLGEVIHPYQAESDVELTLALGDYVVVRKVSNNGWVEGECQGKAGWFPSEFVERRDRVLASKVAEVF